MRRLKTILILSAALAVIPFTVNAQEKGYGAYRTNSWSLYGEGGATWVHGLGMKDVSAAPFTDFYPEFGAGLTYNIRPWVRLGLNYDWSGFTREQRLGEFEPVDITAGPDGYSLTEQGGGLAYAKMNTRYHALDLMAEFNIMEIWKNRSSKRFNLYAGVGGGYMLSYGNTYSISMGHEKWSEGYAEQIHTWLKAKNEGSDWKGAYVPAALTAEYDISPVFTIGVQGNYKYLLNKADLAPAGIVTASLVLRVNLLGKRHGYSTVNRQLRAANAANVALGDALSQNKADCEGNANSLSARAAKAEKEAAELRDRLAAAEKENAALKAAGTASKTLDEVTVLFDNGSFKLKKEYKAELDALAARLKEMGMTDGNDSDIQLVVVGEASATGGSERNYRLSELRIETVIDYLRGQGVDCSRALRQPLGDSVGDKSADARRATVYVKQ